MADAPKCGLGARQQRECPLRNESRSGRCGPRNARDVCCDDCVTLARSCHSDWHAVCVQLPAKAPRSIFFELAGYVLGRRRLYEQACYWRTPGQDRNRQSARRRSLERGLSKLQEIQVSVWHPPIALWFLPTPLVSA